jgi:sugar O-acyltransferase (sialic acid O-acetyltransferase NeuD family)
MAASRVVIFGVGAPLTVDLEESCARLGIEIAAGVRNVPGRSFATDALTIVEADRIPDALKALGIVLPLFTPAHRLAALADAIRLGFSRPETLVDPTSVVARSVALGNGVYVNASCTISPLAQLGSFALVNRATSIGHHTRVGEFASIGPGCTVAGSVVIGRGGVIGAGVVILPGLEIGPNAMVGAGSVVTKSVPAGCLVVGTPARLVRSDLPIFGDMPITPPTAALSR